MSRAKTLTRVQAKARTQVIRKLGHAMKHADFALGHAMRHRRVAARARIIAANKALHSAFRALEIWEASVRNP